MSLKSIEPISNILSFYLNSGGVIRPHFFLTGPTGSGKTHTVTKLAEPKKHKQPKFSPKKSQVRLATASH